MVRVLEEGADLKEYVVLKSSSDGNLFESRMVEVDRGENGKFAVQVADTPPKPAAVADDEGFGHYADWWQQYVKKASRVLSSGATRSGKAVAGHEETQYLAFSERGQVNRIGFRKYGWYVRVFVEDDGSVVTESELTGDKKEDAKIVNSMRFMNLYTMEIEPEVTWEDVKIAADKGRIWYLTEEEAEYAVFYIRCEAFKIYAKEWTNWVRTYGLKAEELGMKVIIS